jgi:hypothetical protein
MADPVLAADDEGRPKRRPLLSEHAVHSLILIAALLAIAVDIALDRRSRHERDRMHLRQSEDQAELMRKAVEASTRAVEANSAEIRKLEATMQDAIRKRP